MPATVEFEWQEGQSPASLSADFEELARVIDRHLEEAMETWALLVEGTAKKLCPVDSGNLWSSISSAVRVEGKSLLKAYIGSNVEYAPFVELGTRYQEAQPYLAPAIEAHLDDAERLFSQAVDNAVAEVS